MKIVINDNQYRLILENQQDELSKNEEILNNLTKYSEENKVFEIKKSPIPYEKGVEDLQTSLQFLGFSLPKWGVDGKFGPETKKAVIDFQKNSNLSPNGKVDKYFFIKLVSQLIKNNFKSFDLNKIIRTKSEKNVDKITSSGIATQKYPTDLVDRFKRIVGDYYETFISDVNSIGLNPTIAIRQLYSESSFRPDVIYCRKKSSVGAMGISQFMSGTWKEFGGGGDPCKIEDSLRAYVKYMKYLLNRFNGRTDLAIAAYNSGPNKSSLKHAYNNDLDFYSLRGKIPDETYTYTSTILQT